MVCSVLSAAHFAQHTIANDLKGGYQVVAADVNHDGKIDLIAVASGQTDLVWYENPGWQRHVIASNLKGMINAAYSNDRIALASEFSNVAQKSLGIVSILVPNGDPRKPWKIKEIDRLPASHRLRWADIDGNGKKVLVNAPLIGTRAEAPNYLDHVPLVFYRPGDWKRELISDANEGVQHGIFVIDWDGRGRDSLLTASFSGIDLYQLGEDGQWKRTEITKGRPAACPKCGSSDVTVGKLGNERFLATIEPWHGNEVAIYRQDSQGWNRTVIDNSLIEGHTIVAADFDGDNRDDIVAGFRGKGGSVLIYKPDSKGTWSKTVLDNAIPANACALADLNGDGRPDLACIGGTVLKWYENLRP
ncbi:MAG: VCBS repeat-containing protein [Bryobacteraceae bacterium]